MYTNPYIKHNDVQKKAKLRLFCLPYAGANSAIFSTWSEVLDSDEMMQLLLPTIRADYKLVETYTPTCKAKLQTEAIVFNSEEDITKEDMLLWQNYFEHSVQYHVFNGGHFFIHSDEKRLLAQLDGLC